MRREDPQFVSETDLHLLPTSPCIDSAMATDAPKHDLDGKRRPYGAGHDRGAYEYSPNDGGEGGEGGVGGAPGEGGTSGEGGMAGEGGAGATTTGGAGNGTGGTEGTAGTSAGGSSPNGGTGAMTTGGASGAGATTTGGTGGSKSSGGSQTDETTGCGCRVPGSERSNGAGAAFVALAAGFVVVRRRRSLRAHQH